MRWFGHVQKSDAGYIMGRMLKTVPPGKRKRGEPKRRFIVVLRVDLSVVGLTEKVEDRTEWKQLFAVATPNGNSRRGKASESIVGKQ